MGNQRIRIGIVGLWTENNYGAVLTTWALYSSLEGMGYEPYLIQFSNGKNEKTKSGEFIREHCKIRGVFKTVQDAAELNRDTDIFLVASDQCWRGGWITEKFGYRFFLNFVTANKKKISYATSFGGKEFTGDEEEKEISIKYLKEFNSISVREKSSASLYSLKLNRKVQWTIDPVFLLPNARNEYKRLVERAKESRLNEGNCVLGVFLDVIKTKIKILNQVSRAICKEPIVLLGEGYGKEEELSVENFYYDRGVYEFLSGIYNADYIVTDSYHGLCFSLLFHKPFTVIINDWRGRERFLSLLEYLGLMDRSVNQDSEEISIQTIEESIDWDSIDQKIESHITESMNWFNAALECKAVVLEKDISNNNSIAIADLEERFLRQKNEQRKMKERVFHLEEFCRQQKIEYQHQSKEILHLRRNIVQSRAYRVKEYIDTCIQRGDRVAIRGGGDHTEKLLPLIKEVFAQKEITLKFVVDKKKPCFSLPVACEWITPSSFERRKDEVDKIIVSSSRYGEELLQELREYCSEEEIINPYGGFYEGELFPKQGWYDL